MCKETINGFIFQIDSEEEEKIQNESNDESFCSKNYVQIKKSEFTIKGSKRMMLQIIDISASIMQDKYKAINQF